MSNEALSKNFSLREMACRCGCGGERAPQILAQLKRLAAALEQLRALAGGRAIRLNCAYRCPAHNAAVGGEPNSFHQRGMAADIVIDGQSPKQTQALASQLIALGGVGHYRTFTHVDIRPRIEGRVTSWAG